MRRIDWLFVTLLLLFAAGLRIVGISFGQPNPDYFPSFAPYGMIHEQLPVHPDEFFSVSIPMNMALRNVRNPEFFNYPAFIINTNFVVFQLTGALDGLSLADRDGLPVSTHAAFSLYVLSRAYSVFGAMLSVACAYAITRLLAGPFAAICAGLLVAVSYTLVQHSHYIKPGTLASGWMMLATWASLASFISCHRRSRHRLYILACLVTGLAATTRYNAAAVFIVVALIGILLIIRGRSLSVLVQIAAGWSLIPLVFLFCSPFTLLDFDHFWRDFSYIVGSYMATGEDVMPYFLVDPWIGFGLMLTYAGLFAIGIPALGCSLLATISAMFGRAAPCRPYQRATRQSVLIIGLMVLVYGIVVLRTVRPGHGDGLLILIIPSIAVLAGIGADRLAKNIRLSSRYTMPMIALLLAIQPLVLSVQVVKMLSQRDTRHIMLDWIHTNVPPGSRFFTNGPYNVPLDGALYPNFFHSLSYASALPEGSEFDYMIYSDAKAFDVLRSHWIVPDEVVEHQHSYLRRLDDTYRRVAEIHRPNRIGSEAMMNNASYWHNPTLIVYCLNRASCENHH